MNKQIAISTENFQELIKKKRLLRRQNSVHKNRVRRQYMQRATYHQAESLWQNAHAQHF